MEINITLLVSIVLALVIGFAMGFKFGAEQLATSLSENPDILKKMLDKFGKN